MTRRPNANTGSAHADIQAILARGDLTVAEKRAAVISRRCDAAEAEALASTLSVRVKGIDVTVVRAIRRGNALHCVVDAPLASHLVEHVCHNPPVLIADPTGSIVVARRNVLGEVIGEKRYREDPRSALETWLRESLERVL